MFDYETSLAGIEKKIRELIAENERLRTEVKELNVGREALRQHIKDNNEVIKRL